MNNSKIQEKWSPQQLKYINFLGRGKTTLNGEKKTNEDFAKAINVNASTLYEWKKLPGFKEAVFQAALADNLDHLPMLLKSQMAGGVKKGKGGETPAATLILKAYQLLFDKVDHTTNGKDMPSPILGGIVKDESPA